MTMTGQVLPQFGIDLSGQHGIGSVICIDGECVDTAMAGGITAPATKPMVTRTKKTRLRVLNQTMNEDIVD